MAADHPTGRRHTTLHRPLTRVPILIEALVLVAAAPFLIFPGALPALTLGALLLIAALWVMSLIVPARPVIPVTPLNLVLIFWCLALIVGIVVSADPAETLEKVAGLILGLAVWRFLTIAVISRQRVLSAAVVMLVAAAGLAAVAMFGLREIPKIPLLSAINPAQFLALPGAGSFAVHPNQLAGMISLYLPAAFALALAPSTQVSGRLRVTAVLSALVGAFALVLTQSRGGWLATATGLVALLILWVLTMAPSRTRRALSVTLVIIGAIAVLLLLSVGPQRLVELWQSPPKETAVGTLQTLNYRKELWPWALTAIGDFPFTGVGLGAFREVAFRLYPVALNPGQDIGHAHNIFLQTALDVGLPGLVSYLALVLLAIYCGWHVARHDEQLRPVAVGLVAGLIALHVFGLADALALGSKPAVLFWYVLGLLTAMHGIASQRTALRA